jgi:hypothetical protein
MVALSVLGSLILGGEYTDSEGVRSRKLESVHHRFRATEGARYCWADLALVVASATAGTVCRCANFCRGLKRVPIRAEPNLAGSQRFPEARLCLIRKTRGRSRRG